MTKDCVFEVAESNYYHRHIIQGPPQQGVFLYILYTQTAHFVDVLSLTSDIGMMFVVVSGPPGAHYRILI